MAPLHAHHIHPRATLNRIHFFLYSTAIIFLLRRHVSAVSLTPSTLLLLFADLVLAFMWLLCQGFRWRPILRREFPHLLPQATLQMPALDVFICTADPFKEPPESVASTALSAMAFDYPADRLSVYVSDDGGSELTLFAFMEAAKFARYWLPFCKENGVMARSPEAYFESGNGEGEAGEMKVLFEGLKERVESAVKRGYVDLSLVDSPEEKEIFMKWKNFTRGDHPSVIQIGFRYGSLVEDFNTGYKLHCEGWRSLLCNPDRPAFLGHAPKNLYDSLSQTRRWVVGLYEVAFCRYCPLFYGSIKASLLTGFCYMYFALWGVWCFPIIVYALLPQLALLYDKPILPKVSDPWFFLYAYLFLAAYGQDFIEFMEVGGLVRRWWSDQRMWLIRGISTCTFGTLDFVLSQIGVSAPGFNLTSKANEEEVNKLYDSGKFFFGTTSPLFISMGTIAIVNLISFVVGFMKAVRRVDGVNEMFLQLMLCGFVVANSLPVYEAMLFRKDAGRMSRSVVNASILLVCILFCVGKLIS